MNLDCESLFQSPDIPLIDLPLPEFQEAGVSVQMLRLDLSHSKISGNKWYKLKYNLMQAQAQGFKQVLSFGGAYSNHLHALAWAGKVLGIETIGIVRGEPQYISNPTLSDAEAWGMQLSFVTRRAYKRRHDSDYLAELQCHYPEALIIPEGGSNDLAVQGCREILSEMLLTQVKPDQVVLACGTGGTLAGVALSVPGIEVLGIPVLKGAGFLNQDIVQLMCGAGYDDPCNWQLDLEGHYGGYAKENSAVRDFMQRMQVEYDLPLDHVYTSKMLFRMYERILEGRYLTGTRVLVIHSGGLQGMRSLSAKK